MFSIAIPFYNEEKNAVPVVEGLVNMLESENINYELILVNNGSKDKTPELLNGLSEKYKKTQVINVYPNEGFGWGVTNGMKAARGDVIGFMCGDGQIAPEALVKVIRKFENENLDFCQIKRIKRQDGLYRMFLSKSFHLITKSLFRIPTSDIGGNPKIIRRTMLEKMDIKSKDWFIETELLSKLGKMNPKVGEVPVVFLKREEGRSNIKFSVVFQFLKNIISYRLHGDKAIPN